MDEERPRKGTEVARPIRADGHDHSDRPANAHYPHSKSFCPAKPDVTRTVSLIHPARLSTRRSPHAAPLPAELAGVDLAAVPDAVGAAESLLADRKVAAW